MKATAAGALAFFLVCVSCSSEQDHTEEATTQTQLDHIIWAVPDLAGGVELFREMSGVDAAVGGVHPGRGTRNYLAAAGDMKYFEIIAPDPEQMPFDPVERPVQAFANQISQMESPEVDMFAFSATDLEVIAERGRELGLQVVGPTPGSRMTPDSVLIQWSHVDFLGHDFGQFVPFALNWLDSPHPSTTSPAGAILDSVVVEHPRADELRRIYEGLGVPASVVEAEEPRIVVFMHTENGQFQVTSGQSLFEYYAARSGENIN